jgi:hypothetical protein
MPLAPVDLSSPGWEVRQAQALWRPDSAKPEIAGDLLIAKKPDGSAFVQFSKTFPIAAARVGPNSWEIEFPPEHRRYAGRGSGPSRVVWLQLIRVLNGTEPAKGWAAERPSENQLTLSNEKSGERIEVYF